MNTNFGHEKMHPRESSRNEFRAKHAPRKSKRITLRSHRTGK